MTKAEAGKLGGQKTSAAKAAAARANSALSVLVGGSGRPRTRTLAQVLRRNDMALQAAFYKLPKRQQGKLQRYFGMPFVNFCLTAQRPATKRTRAVREGIAALLRLSKAR